MIRNNLQKGFSIPLAIIIAGVIIAGAVILSNSSSSNTATRTIKNTTAEAVSLSPGDNFRPPSAEDHVRGNPEAQIAIIEFSDFECPFCARLHPTLSRIVEENDDVQWIFRHFPLSTIHSKALGAAVASECAAKIGGNSAFWSFSDRAFDNQRGLGTSFYNKTALDLGLDTESFNKCLQDKNIVTKIERDLNEAVDAGGRGTPFSVIVTSRGELIPFSGALPYENIIGIIEKVRN